MRYLRILFLAMLAVGLIASGAWAGNITYYGSGSSANTPFSVAVEAMGAGRNLTQSAASNGVNFVNKAALIINIGHAIVSGSLLTVSFTNGGFSGAAVFLCQIDATNNTTGQSPVATAIPAANDTSLSFVIGRGIPGGNNVFVTTSANSTNCSDSNGAFIYRFLPVTSATFATVAYNVSISGTVYDSGPGVNIANFAKQFVTAYGAGNSTIDWTGTNANGARFTGTSNNAAVGGSANIQFTSMDINTAGTSPSAGLTVSAILSLQDSASWSGVQRVYVDGATGGGGCTLASNNAVNNSLAGSVNVNLSIPASAFNGTASFAPAVCVDVKGNTVLQARTIKAAYNISVSSGGNPSRQDTFATVQQWASINVYQGLVPYISAQSIYATICFISNMSSASAAVTASIRATESGASLAGLTGLSLGTLAAESTMRVDFASAITPYTYSGGVESAGTATSLTGLQANDRYTAMINVGASPTEVTVNCLQLDPAGSKRAVPVLTQTCSPLCQ